MSDSVINEVKGWVEAPFVSSVSILDLFLMTGLVMVFIAVWGMILYHIRLAGKTL